MRPLFFLFIFSFSLQSSADSLSEELAKQEVKTISPVEFEGHPVVFQNTQNAWNTPAMICKSLGFTRLVSTDVELKTNTEPRVAIVTAGEVAPRFLTVNTTHKLRGKIFFVNAVTCAR